MKGFVMNKLLFNIFILALFAASIVGCGTATTPTPTQTRPPQVVTVIVTATPPPATATMPLPTNTLTTTAAITPTVPITIATQVAVKPTAKPAATRTPTKKAVAATATALPIKFPAPVMMYPRWQPSDNTDQKDEVKFPSGAIVFKWKGQTGMSGDECYLVTLNFTPVNQNGSTAQDSFLYGCNGSTQIDSVDGAESPNFVLYQPTHEGPNYGSLLMAAQGSGGSEFWVDWSVTVVKNLGDCADKYHCKTVPVSPQGKSRFLMRGGQS
jgi:hypothetical protein